MSYSRVVLKVSGEALAGRAGFGLDASVLTYLAKEIIDVQSLGTQVGVVVGGGNFFRGEVFSETGGIDRTSADQMGMLGTIMNGIALQSAIEKLGVPCRVLSAINVSAVCEPFIMRRAVRHLEKGRIVIFVAGTGNPYYSTDTAAAQRALEIQADCLIKATKVDGVYDKDPKKHADAVKYATLGYGEATSKRLAVMDQTAFALCQEHNLPVIVLDLHEPGSMVRAVQGEPVGTLVEGE
ncbi:MAG: UMP kinase [Armatimonadetes bacterium]|nr:UMP kinase [Armatimonadota bacterium]